MTPGDILGGYAASLTSIGLAKPQIDERMAIIRKSVAKDPRALTAIHFDQLFAGPNPPLRTDVHAGEGIIIERYQRLYPAVSPKGDTPSLGCPQDWACPVNSWTELPDPLHRGIRLQRLQSLHHRVGVQFSAGARGVGVLVAE